MFRVTAGRTPRYCDGVRRRDFLTLGAAGIRLVLLYEEAVRARREALEAERRRGWIEGLHATSVAAALDCVITVDARNSVLSWNPAATRTFGYRAEDAVGDVARSGDLEEMSTGLRVHIPLPIFLMFLQ